MTKSHRHANIFQLRFIKIGLAAIVLLPSFVGCDSDNAQLNASRDSGQATEDESVAAISPAPQSDNVPVATSNPPVNGPVSARLSLEPQRANAGDTIEVFVSLHTAPLWEIGALDAEPPSAATQLTLQLPDGVQAQGDWRAPSPRPSSMPGGHAAYSGEVVFTRQLLVENAAVGGDHEIRCSIGYQACDGTKCLQPAVMERSATLRIAR